MKNKNEITFILDDETIEFIDDLIRYENFRHKIKREGKIVYREDIIKAAIDYFLTDIRNYYKKHIIESKRHLFVPPLQLQNRFKDLMDIKLMKQVELSELTGINKTNLSHILSNKSQPGLDYFIRLWIAFDYPNIEDVLYKKEN